MLSLLDYISSKILCAKFSQSLKHKANDLNAVLTTDKIYCFGYRVDLLPILSLIQRAHYLSEIRDARSLSCITGTHVASLVLVSSVMPESSGGLRPLIDTSVT